MTFDSYTDTAEVDRAAFGERFFVDHHISTVHVVNGRNRWYHEPDWREAIAAVRDAAKGYARVVSYGSSMGGYAALRFADRIGVATALALSPQYSPDPRKAPFEKRWRQRRRERWLPELSDPLPAAIPAIVAYDPMFPAERLHLERIALEMRVDSLSLPYAGHASAAFLSECGLLTEFVLSVVRGTADLAAVRRLARARRKHSLHYLMTLSYAAVGRGKNRVALALGRKATLMAPEAELAWHYLGYLLSRLGRHDEALAAHRRSAALAPQARAIQLCFAAAQRRSRDYDGALRTLLALSGKAMPREARRRIAIMICVTRALRIAVLAREACSLECDKAASVLIGQRRLLFLRRSFRRWLAPIRKVNARVSTNQGL